ncbi:hypothetical protein KCP78_01030 [Salmonella enterica subsp. enterica]|nr:hypothetical protein KCP78_01030 [Salmonella enterica subsp. enterica]
MLENWRKTTRKNTKTFWKQFGLVLKEGPAEDHANREAIAVNCCALPPPIPTLPPRPCRWKITSPDERRAGKIYYITADSYVTAKTARSFARSDRSAAALGSR